MTHSISLFELNTTIQQTFRNYLNESFWIKAEIAQVKENPSGHCYIELIEKDTATSRIIAQSKATIWSTTYRVLKPYFKTTAGRDLAEGLKILIKVKADFHEIYGINLNITDIDPEYTMGDIALQKIETIKKLKDEGIYEMNKALELGIVPQRIAIITSETAAGYLDFITHLNENEYGFAFKATLFQAAMQGERAEASIIDALDSIYANYRSFDTIVMIRGGGSQTDLSCFDSYWLASNIAQFPLPVITGIGHEQDQSVCDMVACMSFKTPTAVAAFFIERFVECELQLHQYQLSLTAYFNQYFTDNEQYINSLSSKFPLVLKDKLNSERNRINMSTLRVSKTVNKLFRIEYARLGKYEYKTEHALTEYFKANKRTIIDLKSFSKKALKSTFRERNNTLALFENIGHAANPENILRKGFSITLFQNKPITSASQLKQGDTIETIVSDGKLKSTVQ